MRTCLHWIKTSGSPTVSQVSIYFIFYQVIECSLFRLKYFKLRRHIDGISSILIEIQSYRINNALAISWS